MDGAKAQQQEDEAVGALSPNFLAETHLPDTKEEAIDVTIHMEDGSALASEESTIRHDARRISWFGFKARLRAATASTRVHISPDTESLDSVELGSISPSTSTAIVSPVSVEGLAQNAGGDIEAAKQDKGPTPTAESAAGYLGRLLQTYSGGYDSALSDPARSTKPHFYHAWVLLYMSCCFCFSLQLRATAVECTVVDTVLLKGDAPPPALEPPTT